MADGFIEAPSTGIRPRTHIATMSGHESHSQSAPQTKGASRVLGVEGLRLWVLGLRF